MTEQIANAEPQIMTDIVLRAMTAEDLPACHGLSQDVGWSHRLQDWKLAFDCGTGWVAESDGVVVGSALYWKWGRDFSTLGLVIVSPDCQGRGIGKKLLTTLLAKLEGSKIRLHATPEGKPLYEKLGFVTTGGICQHQSPELHAVPAPALAADCQFHSLGLQDVSTLTELDALSSGMQRSVLYQALLDPSSSASIEKGLMLTRNGQPVGFSMLRKFGRGYVIGPVIAASLDDAKLLVSQQLSQSAGKFVRLDVEAALGLSEWLGSLGMPCVDQPTTMYKDGESRVSPAGWRNFSLITQAMG